MKNIIILSFILLALFSCNKQNIGMAYTQNGTAIWQTKVTGADTYTQKVTFGATEDPSGLTVEIDSAVCVVAVVGDDIEIEFPTYDIPSGSSIVTSIRVSNFDSSGANIGWDGERGITRTNVLPGDIIIH